MASQQSTTTTLYNADLREITTSKPPPPLPASPRPPPEDAEPRRSVYTPHGFLLFPELAARLFPLLAERLTMYTLVFNLPGKRIIQANVWVLNELHRRYNELKVRMARMPVIYLCHQEQMSDIEHQLFDNFTGHTVIDVMHIENVGLWLGFRVKITHGLLSAEVVLEKDKIVNDVRYLVQERDGNRVEMKINPFRLMKIELIASFGLKKLKIRYPNFSYGRPVFIQPEDLIAQSNVVDVPFKDITVRIRFLWRPFCWFDDDASNLLLPPLTPHREIVPQQ